jgi:hypothetical protein
MRTLCISKVVIARAKPVAIPTRFFASLRMTKGEGFAMTLGKRQRIYGIHYNSRENGGLNYEYKG